MEHTCIREREIGQISADLRRLIKIIEGNGQPGLVTTVPELSMQINTLLKQMEAKKTDNLNGWQKTGIAMSGILGFTSIITALIIKFA